MIRRVPAALLTDAETDLASVQWVNRPGGIAYRFPIHRVTEHDDQLLIVYGGDGPHDARAPQVKCHRGDSVLLELPDTQED